MSYIVYSISVSGSYTGGSVLGPSTNLGSSSDWTNDGNGKFTYTGLLPQIFTIQPDIKVNGNVTSTIYVAKNGIIPSRERRYLSFYYSKIVSAVNIINTYSSIPFIMANGDYLQLIVDSNVTYSSGGAIKLVIKKIVSDVNSYLVSTQNITTSWVPPIYITDSTTNLISTNDWNDNGSGTFTYNGSVSKRFIIQYDLKIPQDPGPSDFRIVKNGYLSGSNTIINSGGLPASSFLYYSSVSDPFIMNNGDYLQLYYDGDTINTGSIKISIVNIPFSRKFKIL